MNSSPRTIAIGDIHGCIHALEAVLEQVAPQPSDTIVCLGDFIDQGRDARDVFDRLIALSTQCELVTILGNHEEMLLEVLDGTLSLELWLEAGGFATLNSYVFGAGVDVIPIDHVEFLRQCLGYYETPRHIFTHAGYEPSLSMNAQPEYALRWALLEAPYLEPHCSGKTVVVGHTEQASGEVLDLGHLICIDTACWRYGWLTALDVASGQTWQASRWGVMREAFHVE